MSAAGVRAGQAYVEIGGDPRKLFAALGKINAQIGKLGASMMSFGTKLAGVGAAVGAPLAMASRTFAQFDDAIRATAAVSGAAGSELQMLNDRARELGATTSYTAIQVANLMTELGRAGFRPDEINAMTGAVLDLARATGTDAALSAGIMAASLRQFSLGATDATRVADVLTKAANSTFNTVEGLGESLKYAGPVASSLGMSLEDTVSILGALGNVGIQGSEAGTALRRLSVISAATGDELKNLFGVTNVDAAGNLKPLVDILDEINTVTAAMPVAQRTEKMSKAFGLLGITSATVLSRSAGGVRGLAKDLKNAEGTAARTAKEMDAGLGGATRIALSAIEGTALAIADALAPQLQQLITFIGQTATAITGFVKENQGMVIGIAKGAGLAVLAGGAFIGLGVALKIVAGSMALLASPLFAIVAALTAAGVAIGTSTGLFGQLGDTAKTTMGGIYEAIAAGDLAGAMDILWAGLHAGWLRGVATLMQYVDPWIAGFQNTFTYMGAEIAIIFGSMMSGISQVLNTGKAIIMGVVDNIVNGVMASFDAMVSAVRKSWNWVQSFIVRGYDLAKENEKVDNEMAARRRQRGIDRPGVQGRMAQAAQENAALAEKTQGTIDFIGRRSDSIAAGRLARNDQLVGERNAAADAAEARLGDMSRGARDRRIFRDQANSVIDEVAKAQTMDDLRDLAQQFHLLAQTGELTAEQQKRYGEAVDAASERINESDLPGAAGPAADPAAMQRAGADAAAKQAEVAGTFSAAALGGMGIGQSLAQKQLDVMKQIEQNTRPGDDGLVGD